jgi:hypothetical protein
MTFTTRMLLLVVCLPLAACQTQPPGPTAASGSNPAQPPFKTTATVRDIMLHMVDPAGDLIWDSVSTTVDTKGLHEVEPKTDEDWAKVRTGAITLAEASNLLMMPRPVARAHEKSVAPGIELEPSEMEELIKKDPAGWYQRAAALREVSVKVLEVVDKRDVKGLFDIGEPVDKACENCHRQYWYPNEPVQPLTNEPEPVKK